MSSKGIIVLIVLVQFINALDFVLVMPMGPDIALGLNFETSYVAWLASSYTISAAIVAVLSVLKIDQYDRKKVLVVSLSGMMLTTMMGGFAPSFDMLLLSRFLAGGFGGLAISIGVSIIADTVPEEQRGRALSMVMAGFPLSAILGIPLALYVSEALSWHWAFYLLSVMILCVVFAVLILMPKMTDHRLENQGLFQLKELFRRPEMGIGVLLVGFCVFPAFFIVPHASTITQFNYEFPRDSLSFLYLATGIINLVFVVLTGKLSDKYSSLAMVIFWLILYAANVYVWLVVPADLPAAVMHIAFFVSFTALMIPVASLSSKIPRPNERAGFSALQSFFQYIGIGIASSLSAYFIESQESGALTGLSLLGKTSLFFVTVIPILVWFTERRVNRSRADNTEASTVVYEGATET